MSPMPHPHIKNKYIVAVAIEDEEYLIYMFDNLVRKIKKNKLPSFMKSKLTMINALSLDRIKPDNELYELDIYVHNERDGFEDTGWRASENMYALVFNLYEMADLQGGYIDA